MSAQDFPGARIEVNAGFDSVRGRVAYADSANPANDFAVDESTNGAAYGATVGYDLRFGRGWYVGAEASVDLAENDRCEEVIGNDQACFEVGRNLAVGGRFGSRLGADAMFYVGAAYVNGQAKVSYRDPAMPTNDFSYSENRGGVRLSTGIEHRLAGRFFGKLEYRYSNYSDYAASVGTETATLGFDRHQAIAGLGLRF